LKRSTLIAFVVLAALGAYIYWFEREPVPEGEGEAVFDVQEDAIDRIEIHRGSDPPVVLEREGKSAWRLSSPVSAGADQTEADLVLQNLRTMRFDRVVAKASSSKLAEFGLDPPKISVRFHTADGDQSIAFGSDAPTPSKQYARRDEGDDILVLASHLSLNFDKGDWDFRDKRVFALEGSPGASRIQMDRPAGKLVLSKEKGLWFVAEPRGRADRGRVGAIVSRVRDAEMKEIVVAEKPGSLEEHGLDSPSRRVRLELESESPKTLEIEIGESAESGYYARSPSRSEVFLLAEDLISELDAPASDLFSKRLFDYSTFEAKRVLIERKDQAARELERVDAGEEKKWRESQPAPGRDLEKENVEDLLHALNGAAGTVSTETIEGSDLTIAVWSGDPLIEERVSVRKRDPGVSIQRAGEAVSLALTEEAWKEIESKLSALEATSPDTTPSPSPPPSPPP
jgi:hypothetical protein